jgi:hypothetical protein
MDFLFRLLARAPAFDRFGGELSLDPGGRFRQFVCIFRPRSQSLCSCLSVSIAKRLAGV